MNRASGTCGTIMKDLTFVLLESKRAKKEHVEIVAENFPKPAGNMILQIQEAEQTSIGQTLKNLHQDTSSSNFRNLNTKEKTLKATRGRETLPIGEK